MGKDNPPFDDRAHPPVLTMYRCLLQNSDDHAMFRGRGFHDAKRSSTSKYSRTVGKDSLVLASVSRALGQDHTTAVNLRSCPSLDLLIV